jgi:hypothetical protein
MTTPAEFETLLSRTHWIISEQAKGLTHEDSVRQLPFRGNCFNWVLGHILESRSRMLGILGYEPFFDEAETALYKRGSEPITDGATAVPFPTLLQHLHDSQEKLTAYFQQATPDDLAAETDSENWPTLLSRVSFFHWHETYHVGQLKILRQLAGTDDAIIK